MAVFASLGLGVFAGYVMRSRWAMLVTPVVVAVAFELRWVWLDGPTVDAPRFDTSYGFLAIVLGRGFFFFVCTVPMLLGVAVGTARARAGSAARTFVAASRAGWALPPPWRRDRHRGRRERACLLHSPTGNDSTDHRCKREHHRRQRQDAREGGVCPAVSSRSRSAGTARRTLFSSTARRTRPERHAVYRFLYSDIAKDFVVVDWDQRGNGKSMSAIDPTPTYTLDSIVGRHGGAFALPARAFDERKIYLAGTSWGSTLGVLTVQRHPELFHAFIGGGQMVSQRETDIRIYRDLMAHAQRTGDTGVVASCARLGRPLRDSTPTRT